MKIVTSADSLNAVESMVNMLEAREWAEHSGVCPVTRRLETCITTLHNEIAQKNKECEKYELDNYQAVEFLGGQSDGLANLCNIYRDEIWRLRDGINALLNICTPENNDHILRELRDLATSKIEVCPPLKDQKVVGARYACAFDALIDDPEERADLKERSRLMRVIRNEITDRYGKKEYKWLADNVGFSQSIWEAIYTGQLDELEQDVLVQIADMLKINIIPGECDKAQPHVLQVKDVNDLAHIAHVCARAIVVHARAMNQTGTAERYMVPVFCACFKITKQEWLTLEVMHRQKFATDALPISRLIQIANDGNVILPAIDLDN